MGHRQKKEESGGGKRDIARVRSQRPNPDGGRLVDSQIVLSGVVAVLNRQMFSEPTVSRMLG